MRAVWIGLLLCLTAGSWASALTPDHLLGKWRFERMVFEDGTERPVGATMDFQGDGQVISYNSGGQEMGKGNWKMGNGQVHYKDKHGEQIWQVISFDGDTLQVDHGGVQMYFTRP